MNATQTVHQQRTGGQCAQILAIQNNAGGLSAGADSFIDGLVTRVIKAANGRWPEILVELAGHKIERNKPMPCPVCGGTDRFTFDDKAGRGTWLCRKCPPKQGGDCASGDGLDLVSGIIGMGLGDAARKVAPLVGVTVDGPRIVVSAEQVAADRSQREAKQEQARQEKAARQRKAAERAQTIIGSATQQAENPYLSSKGFGHIEVMVTGKPETICGEALPKGSLVVPLVAEIDGPPVNCQLIRANEDGSSAKLFLPGSQVAGAFHRIDGTRDRIAVCEGYATGLTLNQLTGNTVLCAMNADNLFAVTAKAHSMGAETVVIAADNDKDDKGQKAARKAQAEHGGVLAIPPEVGDWNDHQQAHGTESTRRELLAQIESQGASQDEAAPWSDAANPLPVSADGGSWTDDRQDGLPTGFTLNEFGLWFDGPMGPIQLSSPLAVTAIALDSQGMATGRLLEFNNFNGQTRQLVMLMEHLAGSGEEIRRQLLRNEIQYVTPSRKHRDMFHEALMKWRPAREVTCLDVTGWHGGHYVMPHMVIGQSAESVMFQGRRTGDGFAVSGDLSEWRNRIGLAAIDNSRLAFAISLAFSGPLLSLVGMDGGGFHLKGDSTDGKTTIMKAAGSVYGKPAEYCHTWRATGNAIEGIASRRNDALLCLDEIAELDPREAGAVAYMLANGQGKGRAHQDGELRERKRWRLMFLSSGELSLADHATEAGRRTRAGVEVRVLQIPSSTGKFGAFECLHESRDGREFADSLSAAANELYGSPLVAFLNALVALSDPEKRAIKGRVSRMAEELTPSGAGNQVGRAVNRFALVAVAGELATEFKITGWQPGEATRAAKTCLDAWITERGGLDNREMTKALEQVRDFLSANQYSRLVDWHDTNHRPSNVVGYRRSDPMNKDAPAKIYITPTGWKVITEGYDPKAVAQAALDAGLIKQSGDTKKSRTQITFSLPGGGRMRGYEMTPKAMGQEDDIASS